MAVSHETAFGAKSPVRIARSECAVPDLNDVPLGRRRREEAHLVRSRGFGGREPQFGDAVPETRGPVRPHEELQVAARPAPACGERAVVLAPDEEAGARRVGQKGRERPEEAGLLDVGASVLGAEDVAVPAVVAGVGPVRELVRRRLRPARRERPLASGREVAAADDEVAEDDCPGRRFIREIRVVRADRDALVAVDAVQEVEVRSDLARQAAGLRGPVALGAKSLPGREAMVQEGSAGGVATGPSGAGPDEIRDGRGARFAHRPGERFRLPVEALVATRPKKVRTARDRHEAARDRARHVRRVDPGGERDRKRRAELVAEASNRVSARGRATARRRDMPLRPA